MLVKKIIILVTFVLTLVFLVALYFVTNSSNISKSFLNIETNIPDQTGISLNSNQISIPASTSTSDGPLVVLTDNTDTTGPTNNTSTGTASINVNNSTQSNAGQNIKLRINFYCYSFDAESDLNCTKNESDIKATLIDVNKIWAQAGIEWVFNSFSYKRVSAGQFDLTGSETAQDVLSKLGSINIAEVSTNNSSIWNVAIIRNFPPAAPAAGVYFPSVHTLYLSEIKKMKTGSTDTKNFVLAHELGHSLTLAHVDQTTMPNNLMVPGAITVAIPSLTTDQINQAKVQALKGHPANNDEMPRATGTTVPQNQPRTRTR
jgi:hypothetical protein